MPPQITHIAFHVRYLDAMVAFYGAYCRLVIEHDRQRDSGRVVWLAEQGRGQEFVVVLIDSGPGRDHAEGDFSYLGFALAGREVVDEAAVRGGQNGYLMWPVREEPYSGAYYCGLRDPDGNWVEHFYGQRLEPGAADGTAALDGAMAAAGGAKT